jgi:signal transduction histidine kinase
MALRSGTQVIGLQVVGRRRGATPFSLVDRRIAEGIAQVASMALANARLLEQLEQMNRHKSEFVSTVSHELRTPLNVLLGFAEIARGPQIAPAERDDVLRKIEEAGKQLFELIESTLAVGKLEMEREEIRLEDVVLDEFWRDLERECRLLPGNPAVRLEWVGTLPPVTVVTDPWKVRTVVRNLVGNAFKFTERGGVRVEAHGDGEGITIRVADTGIGMAAEHVPVIFDMFRQVDGSSTRRFGGLGLGLHIVRRLTELLGGRVTVQSSPGVGSTFTVVLPLHEQSESEETLRPRRAAT